MSGKPDEEMARWEIRSLERRMCRNRERRAEADRARRTFFGWLFQPGPAAYIDSIADDITSEERIAEIRREFPTLADPDPKILSALIERGRVET